MDTIQKAIQAKLTETVLGSLGKKFGIDLSKSNGIVKIALPLILAALAKNATKKNGASSLSSALAADHDGSILDHLEDLAGSDSIQTDGAKILGHVFGGKENDVTKLLSNTVEVDESAAKGMLSSLAPVVMGQLGKTQKEQSLDADSLSSMLKGEETEAKSQLGGLMAMLDADNDGSVVDDLMDLGKKFLR